MIEQLLESLNNGPQKHQWTPNAHGSYLVSNGDCTIGIHLNKSGSHVSFYTHIGYLDKQGWLSERTSPWSTTSTAEDGASQTLCVDHVTGKTMLIRSWPRESLDTVRFRQELVSFADSHREWSSMLSSQPSGDKPSEKTALPDFPPPFFAGILP